MPKVTISARRAATERHHAYMPSWSLVNHTDMTRKKRADWIAVPILLMVLADRSDTNDLVLIGRIGILTWV